MGKTRKVDVWALAADFFDIYLDDVRRMSKGTIQTYRYGLYSFVSFLCDRESVEASALTFDHFSRNNAKAFVAFLHLEKGLSAATCNLRLSILKSFLRYCADEYVHLFAVYQSVRSIPITKPEPKSLEYLSEGALKALLSAPNPSTRLGIRDRMLLIFMYDTGCRVQELVDVRLGDLQLENRPHYVVVTGKGNKTRMIPLMEKTVAHLCSYLQIYHHRPDNSRPLFYLMKKQGPAHLSTDAVAVLIKKHGSMARKNCIDIPVKLHPHLLRRTRAMHLYINGMPLEVVAKFLGHVDSSTIAHYATANLAMITAAVEKANPEVVGAIKNWKDPQILKRLVGL